MCLIFFALHHHPEYKLIVAGNRDEFYNRKTAPAAFWEEHPHILGGRDLEAMGTWLGVTRNGKISMVTNYRDVKNLKTIAPSRGKLVSDYLITEVEPDQYLQEIRSEAHHYNGFNLIAGTPDALWYYSNYDENIRHLTKGTFGLSNHLLDTPWPKVSKGKAKFNQLLESGDLDPEELFELLYDEEPAQDNFLPDTGLPVDRERALSAIFIKTPDYGSRCSTVILIDYKNQVFFTERIFDLNTFEYTTQRFQFSIKA